MAAAASAAPPATYNDDDDDDGDAVDGGDDDKHPAASGPANASVCVSMLTLLLWLLVNTAFTAGVASVDGACLQRNRFFMRLRGVRWECFTGFLAFSRSLVSRSFTLSQALHNARLLFRNFMHNSNGQLPSKRSRPPPHDGHDLHNMASGRIEP